MRVRELAVAGALEFTPTVLPDERGVFLELLRKKWWTDALGRPLEVAQVNCTVSHRNVVRGVHFTRLVGQAKFVCCMSGSMIDVVYDTRIGSPTYGQYDAIRLEPDTFQIVLIPEGVAHGVASLADRTTVFYLCSAPYDPDNEFGVHPMDPELGIDWRGMLGGADPILSERDSTAPKLAEVREEGLLPPYEQCLEVYGQAEGTGGR